jgi:hypothetical protein
MGSAISAHAYINMFFTMTSIGIFAAGLAGATENEEFDRALWIAGLVGFFLYPIITEIMLNLKAACCKKNTSK